MPKSTSIRPARTALGALVAVAATLFLASPASAHVKWFCGFDVAGQPEGLANVLCCDFEVLVGCSMLALMVGCLVEGSPLGSHVLRLLDFMTVWFRENTGVLVRATVGFFLISLWNLGDVILTPELKTASPLVPWFQLAMAASLLSRRTMPLCGIGIVALYATATMEYGVFHMMDYPIFLGLAAWLVMEGWDVRPYGARPLDVLRWTMGATLMWASVEKWAYPFWTAPLFVTHPTMAMGIDQDFFMRAAGAVEFALAFGLLMGPLVRRCSAILLAMIFISAVPAFGNVDMIGHSCIIAALFAVIAQSSPASRRFGWSPLRRMAVMVPASYAGALAVTLTCYYALHSAMFGTTIL